MVEINSAARHPPREMNFPASWFLKFIFLHFEKTRNNLSKVEEKRVEVLTPEPQQY